MGIFLRIVRKEIEEDTLSIYAFYSYIYSFSFYLRRDIFSLYIYNSYSYSYPVMSMTFGHDGQKDFTQGILLLALLGKVNILPDNQAQNLDSLTKEWDFTQENFSHVPLFLFQSQNKTKSAAANSFLFHPSVQRNFFSRGIAHRSFQISSGLENYISNF